MEGLAFSALAVGIWAVLKKVSAVFHLDFDDAYQYVTSEKFNLVIVSFDADFDRTDRKRVVPAEIR